MKQVLRSFLSNYQLGEYSYRDPDGYIKSFVNEELYLSVPQKPGAYVITSNTQKFIYPNGKSKVIYIGMSNNLLNRLCEHQKTVVDMDGAKKKS